MYVSATISKPLHAGHFSSRFRSFCGARNESSNSERRSHCSREHILEFCTERYLHHDPFEIICAPNIIFALLAELLEASAGRLFIFMRSGEETDIFDDDVLYNTRPLVNDFNLGSSGFSSETLDCLMGEGQFLGPLEAECDVVTFTPRLCKAVKHVYTKFQDVTAEVVGLSICTEHANRRSKQCLSLKESIRKYLPQHRVTVHAWEEFEFDARLWDDYWADPDTVLKSSTGVEAHFLSHSLRVFSRYHWNVFPIALSLHL